MVPNVCPECASEHLIANEDGTFTCESCGAQWAEAILVCPRCGHTNDPFADRCANCGEVLSMVDRVLSRQADSRRARWLEEARQQARGIKASEEASSQQRFGKLVEADRARKEALRKAQEEQEERERRTISATLAIAALILVAIVIATLVITIRG